MADDSFPSLFDSEELDRVRVAQLEREYPKAPPYHPFPIVEREYPRVAHIICQLWGTPEMDRFFNKVLIDDRGNRAGFPPDVVKALLTLSQQHQRSFRYRTPHDVWIGNDPSVARHSGR